jgi:hypothetical protein
MKAVVFSSILMLGFINFLVAAFYINQTSSINLVSIVTACLIAFTVYVTGFDPLASNIRVFVFVLLCNIIIIGSMIGVHYIPFTKKALFTSSEKYIEEQREYERLLR